MIDAIDEAAMVPNQFLKDSSGNFTIRSILLFSIGRIVSRHYSLFSTLSPSVLALTIGHKSGRGVWRVLEK